MRVITGLARGGTINTLEGLDTRPTGARVKAGIFSALQFDIEGRKVLDLFAGSGQMGIEMLSRGADSVVFVESNKKAYDIIKGNLKSLEKYGDVFSKNAFVYEEDAFDFIAKAIKNGEKYSIIFLDPPYESDYLERALNKVDKILNLGGVVICESEDNFKVQIANLKLHKEYRYGRAKMAIYHLTD